MHPISLIMAICVTAAGTMLVWSCYDLYILLRMRRALVRSLASDAEFVNGASHVWETGWEDQYVDEEFKKLRSIIQRHIDQLRFRRPASLLQPLNQAHLINRLRYIRGLAYDVEKRLEAQPQ
jgi:hypothetical protein